MARLLPSMLGVTVNGATLAMHARHDCEWRDSCLAPAAFSSNKKSPALAELLELRLANLAASC